MNELIEEAIKDLLKKYKGSDIRSIRCETTTQETV